MAMTMQATVRMNSIGADSDIYPDWYNAEHKTGTTIMAVEYDGGVVFGADSRTTTGAYIVNRVTDKLTPVTENIFCCRSGSAADTQAIADQVKYNLYLLRMELGEQTTVKTAANLFKEICYAKRDSAVAGIIVAGWDEKSGGQVFTVPLGGMCVRQPFSIGGSGSTYIYGHCDATYKHNMTKEECYRFVANAVALAMFRDGSSGGVIRMAAVNKDGVERRVLTGNEIPRFYEGQ
ncbi:proteasome subunit beta type-6-like [Rhopilema esculentum]|uniref:proteasome subunit beta type-6-like n=1 Tax=Rhopilema esculentum TaxID=499914 RepID=UPI0031D5FFBF|eukprot:gene6639-12180_t